VGQAKLLEHKDSKRIRFIMRENKTLKIRSNHVVIPGTKVQEHSGSEKAMVWSCVDFAEEVQRPELFCIRFASAERALEFKAAYEEACEKNAPLLGGGSEEEEEGGGGGEAEPSDADKAADELAKATVKDEEATA
jgi:Ran-binding protein 1